MNQLLSEAQGFAKLLLLIAKKANYEMDQFEVELMRDELRPYGWSVVNEQLRKYFMRMRSGDRFPSIQELKEACDPGLALSESDQAQNVASRIIESVSKFGSSNSGEARRHMGELGWACVSRFGGWTQLCQELTTENKGTYYAQLRELAKTVHKLSCAGTLHLPPELPAPLKALTAKIGSIEKTY